MSQPGSLCVGIDVSKAILDIAASSAIEQFSVGNDSDGFEAIIAELRMYCHERCNSDPHPTPEIRSRG